MLHNMHVASVCFMCFGCFICMLQVFQLDVAKVDLDVACVCNGFEVICKCFRRMFARASVVLDIYCKCFIYMLQK